MAEFDIDRVRRSFDRAAHSYERAAVLQREIENRLLESLQLTKLKPSRILDAGCGIGTAYPGLRKLYPSSEIVAMDLSEDMLQHTRSRGGFFRKPVCVCGQLEELPFADDSFDLIFSNLAIQWCNSLPTAFEEMQRVLRPEGLVMFTTFGPDTLKELKQSWRALDESVHVNKFDDMHDVGDALLAAGFSDPVMHCEQIVMTYQDAMLLMQDLRDIGANVTADGHMRGLLTRDRLRTVLDAYESFRGDDGLPATYEVVYGHAWKPDRAIRVHFQAG